MPGPPFFILRDLDGCWHHAPLKDAILDELRNPDNTPAEYAAFLEALLEAGDEPALDHALGLLAGPRAGHARPKPCHSRRAASPRGRSLVARTAHGDGVR